MRDLVFWTWVVGGAPLALALIRRVVEWLRDVVRSGMIARTHAAGQRPASGSTPRWKHV
jgi:hypothetical protein